MLGWSEARKARKTTFKRVSETSNSRIMSLTRRWALESTKSALSWARSSILDLSLDLRGLMCPKRVRILETTKITDLHATRVRVGTKHRISGLWRCPLGKNRVTNSSKSLKFPRMKERKEIWGLGPKLSESKALSLAQAMGRTLTAI
jgi:hypothetical protein